MVKIEKKEYYLNDYQEKNYAIKHINRLLVEPILKTKDEEGEEDMDDIPSPGKPASTPPPPPPPSPEPEDEE